MDAAEFFLPGDTLSHRRKR